MKRAIAVSAVVALAAIGAGVFFLTRPSADIDHYGGYGTWTVGDGVVVASVSATNTRDHDVELAVPEEERAWLARNGVRVTVGFIRMNSAVPRSSPDGLRSTMPANASGAITHVYRVDDCEPVRDLSLTALPLEIDGHAARVQIEPTSGEYELRPYEDEVIRRPVRFNEC